MPLLIGLALLIAFILLARWFESTPPRTVMLTVKWSAISILIGGITLLMAVGMGGWVLAILLAALPWLLRVLLERDKGGGSAGGAFPGMGNPGNAGNADRSSVETRFLRMTLDHRTGALEGVVETGPFRGRSLSDLSLDEALGLRRQCANDPQSIQVLEAWLDRVWPDWRDEEKKGKFHTDSVGGAMDREEALAVLGLGPNATEEEIRAAHRRLMAATHPDHGGSNYLAAKINQAKDVLLGG